MTAAHRRRYAVKPTRCVNGCGRTLTASNYRRKQYTCFTCDNARRGHVPMYHGPCVRCGQRQGRGRSALCAGCLSSMTRRRRRQHALLASAIGKTVPLETLIQFMHEPTMQQCAVKVFAAIFDGRLSLVDGQAYVKSVRARWNKAR